MNELTLDGTSEISEIENENLKINEGVLNTPAQDVNQKIPKELKDPTRQAETYFEMNTPKNISEPDRGVVVNLDGKTSEIEKADMENTKLGTLKRVLGYDEDTDEYNPIGPGLIFLIIIGSFLLFVIFIINKKRTEHILKLEDEIQKLKNRG